MRVFDDNFSYFSSKPYVVTPHLNRLDETVQMIGHNRAREIVGFAGSGPIFETENRFISRQEAKKSVHKILYFSRFCNTQTDIVTCQNCPHLIIRCYLS